jgi:hypothetical protein
VYRSLQLVPLRLVGLLEEYEDVFCEVARRLDSTELAMLARASRWGAVQAESAAEPHGSKARVVSPLEPTVSKFCFYQIHNLYRFYLAGLSGRGAALALG